MTSHSMLSSVISKGKSGGQWDWTTLYSISNSVAIVFMSINVFIFSSREHSSSICDYVCVFPIFPKDTEPLRDISIYIYIKSCEPMPWHTWWLGKLKCHKICHLQTRDPGKAVGQCVISVHAQRPKNQGSQRYKS